MHRSFAYCKIGATVCQILRLKRNKLGDVTALTYAPLADG